MVRLYGAVLLFVLFALVPMSQAQAEACVPADPDPVSLETYYAPAAGATGSALRAALHGIIKGHRRFSYTCVWTILEDTDVDPANPDNVIALYTGRSIPKSRRDQGQNDPDSWNREHVWPKSHGFPHRHSMPTPMRTTCGPRIAR